MEARWNLDDKQVKVLLYQTLVEDAASPKLLNLFEKYSSIQVTPLIVSIYSNLEKLGRKFWWNFQLEISVMKFQIMKDFASAKKTLKLKKKWPYISKRF